MSKLPESEVEEMLSKLSLHFGERVMPMSFFCKSIQTWFDAIEENNSDEENKGKHSHQGKEYYKYLRRISVDIRKSFLLYRLLYLNEPLRTEKCPIHKGHWDGQAQLVYGCVYAVTDLAG